MYTSQSNIEAKLGKSLTTSQASYFTSVLDDMIDTFINNETETTFGYTGADVVYYLSGECSKMLTLPTVHNITEVRKVNTDGTDGDVLTKNTDYTEYPRGAADTYALTRLNDIWDDGFENYKVTAEPGYSAIPADIVHVATEIAVNILTTDNNNYKNERVGDWSVTYNNLPKQLSQDSLNILANYRRLSRDI